MFDRLCLHQPGNHPGGCCQSTVAGRGRVGSSTSAGAQFPGVVVGGNGTQYTAPRFPGTEKRHGHTETHCSCTGFPVSWFCLLALWQHSTGVKSGFWWVLSGRSSRVSGFHGVPRGWRNYYSVDGVPVLVDGATQHTTPGGGSRWVSIVPRFRLVPGAVLVLLVVPGCTV